MPTMRESKRREKEVAKRGWFKGRGGKKAEGKRWGLEGGNSQKKKKGGITIMKEKTRTTEQRAGKQKERLAIGGKGSGPGWGIKENSGMENVEVANKLKNITIKGKNRR